MTNRTIKKYKWFWAWQDEKEEVWLREMSNRGYHLSSIVLPGIYNFTVTKPRDYVYRLDYQPYSKRDKNEYLQLFRDAGWEHIGEMAAWQYFRKEAVQDETPEIFTDIESKTAKYKRLITYLFILLLPIWTIVIIQWTENPFEWLVGIKIFIVIVAMFLLYGVIRIAIRIKQLRQHIQQ